MLTPPTKKNNFSVGDKVVLQMGSGVRRKGVIESRPHEHHLWSHLKKPDGSIEVTELAKYPPLAFTGEDHYFAWLHNVCDYLILDV